MENGKRREVTRELADEIEAIDRGGSHLSARRRRGGSERSPRSGCCACSSHGA